MGILQMIDGLSARTNPSPQHTSTCNRSSLPSTLPSLISDSTSGIKPSQAESSLAKPVWGCMTTQESSSNQASTLHLQKQMAYGHVAVGEPTWATFKLDKPVSTKANDKFWVGLIALDPGCGEMKLEAPAPGLGYNFNITYIDTTFPKKLNLHYFPHFTSFGPRAVAVINSDK
eukprot:TRINITY_DN46196_c0_g1_i1.p1 TRINITY_DN46196_c0_g1~~TRINITY_DN46196_c0_g1_i1.p1  ORF type:complete len:173 (-),score=13.83 TRINITY_DN46196_c0_g1_i1:74-592(-)